MEDRRRAAGHPLLAAAEAEVGNPGQIVPEVRQAGVVAAAGAVAGNATPFVVAKSEKLSFWRM
jgi:hypothetical protein